MRYSSSSLGSEALVLTLYLDMGSPVNDSSTPLFSEKSGMSRRSSMLHEHSSRVAMLIAERIFPNLFILLKYYIIVGVIIIIQLTVLPDISVVHYELEDESIAHEVELGRVFYTRDRSE